MEKWKLGLETACCRCFEFPLAGGQWWKGGKRCLKAGASALRRVALARLDTLKAGLHSTLDLQTMTPTVRSCPTIRIRECPREAESNVHADRAVETSPEPNGSWSSPDPLSSPDDQHAKKGARKGALFLEPAGVVPSRRAATRRRPQRP